MGCHRPWTKKQKQKKAEKYGQNRNRLRGGGRKAFFPEVDAKVLTFYENSRNKKLRVNRKRLKLYAMQVHREMVENGELESKVPFNAAGGWVVMFIRRNALSERRSTTASQRLPEEYREKSIRFIRGVAQARERFSFGDHKIIACDETGIWLDAVSKTTVAEKGAKVQVRSTGHEKERVKRPDNALIKKYKGKAVIMYEGAGWMNEKLTISYLDEIINRDW